MKKLLFAIAFSITLTIALFAQANTATDLSVNDKRSIGRSELKISVARDFARRFRKVDNATWSSNKDYLRAKFTLADVKYMVDYDQKGKWVSTIRVYNESELSRELRKMVKSNYIDYSIVKVIEVNIGKSHVYFIKLENESSLLTLHIMNGEITEIENYRKG